MAMAVVIVPPVCEMRHDCTPHQVHNLIQAYIWAGIVVGALIVFWLGYCAIDRVRDRRRNRW